MKLNINQWHVRLYFWCLDVWDEFRNTHTSRNKANLCQYIRTIFVWMPLTLVAQIFFLALTFYVLAYYPVAHFGWTGYGWIILCIAIIVGCVFLFSYIKRKWKDREFRHLATLAQSKQSSDGAEKDHGPNLIQVIWLYLVATKKKICPMIEFKDNSVKGGV